MADLKFCKDCAWFDAISRDCAEPSQVVVNLVDGKALRYSCALVRSMESRCGESAKLFKPTAQP